MGSLVAIMPDYAGFGCCGSLFRTARKSLDLLESIKAAQPPSLQRRIGR